MASQAEFATVLGQVGFTDPIPASITSIHFNFEAGPPVPQPPHPGPGPHPQPQPHPEVFTMHINGAKWILTAGTWVKK